MRLFAIITHVSSLFTSRSPSNFRNPGGLTSLSCTGQESFGDNELYRLVPTGLASIDQLKVKRYTDSQANYCNSII